MGTFWGVPLGVTYIHDNETSSVDSPLAVENMITVDIHDRITLHAQTFWPRLKQRYLTINFIQVVKCWGLINVRNVFDGLHCTQVFASGNVMCSRKMRMRVEPCRKSLIFRAWTSAANGFYRGDWWRWILRSLHQISFISIKFHIRRDTSQCSILMHWVQTAGNGNHVRHKTIAHSKRR